MKASHQLSPALLLLILLALSTYAQQARPPELLLATFNIVQRDLAVAYTNTAEAFRKPQLTNAKAHVAGAVCGFHRALVPYQLTIDILTRNFGPRFTTLGVAYALRAQVLDYTGDHDQAVADYQHALSLLQQAPGRDTPAYLTVQLAYCHSLRKAGLEQKDLCLEKA
jgi:tetratricopeptide (TPR) repeat protein